MKMEGGAILGSRSWGIIGRVLSETWARKSARGRGEKSWGCQGRQEQGKRLSWRHICDVLGIIPSRNQKKQSVASIERKKKGRRSRTWVG